MLCLNYKDILNKILLASRGTFEGEFGVRHCNQWQLYGVRVRQRLSRRSCGLRFAVVRAVGRGIAVLEAGLRRARGRGRGGFGGFLFSIFTMGNAIGSPTVKCFRFICENLTFAFGKRIFGKLDSCAFWVRVHTVISIFHFQWKVKNEK